jgi:hypothetical protein
MQLSIVGAVRLSLSEAPDCTVSNIDTGVQTALYSYGEPMDSLMNEESSTSIKTPLDFDSLPLDPAANEFALPFQADRMFFDGLYNDLINLDRSTSPDSSCTSLDDCCLEVVNEIELEDLEAYLLHALDCT